MKLFEIVRQKSEKDSRSNQGRAHPSPRVAEQCSPHKPTSSLPKCAGILLAGLLAANAWSVLAGAAPGRRHVSSEPVRFAVLSDIHYFDARLGASGPAFEAYLDQDPKLLKESDAILDSALDSIIQQQVQFVIVTGDLTKDGEAVDHVRVAQHLTRLEQHGVQVFVVPGNHDINNPDAVAYNGANTRKVANVSPQLFRAVYHRFGYGQALARDPHSLSYIAEPVPGLWLIGIDSCKYEESKQLGYPVVSGRLKPETLSWVLDKLGEAKARGKQVIAFMHHGVTEHFMVEPLLFPDFVLDDWVNVSAQLAAAGLKVVFTGHYHSQDASYALDAEGRPTSPLCDIETGSLAMYPCAFRLGTLDSAGNLSIQSQRVTEINADTGGKPFQEYAEDALRARLPDIVTYQLMTSFHLPQGQAAQIAPPVVDALVANYAGDEVPTPEAQAEMDFLLGSPEPLHTLGMMLLGVWTDLPPGDNQLLVPLGSH